MKKVKVKVKICSLFFSIQLFLSYMKSKCVSTATLSVRSPNEEKKKTKCLLTGEQIKKTMVQSYEITTKQ